MICLIRIWYILSNFIDQIPTIRKILKEILVLFCVKGFVSRRIILDLSRVSISQFVSTKSYYMYQHFIWNSVFVALGLLMLICDIAIKNVMQERTLLLSLKSKTFSDWLFILFVYNKNQRRIQLNPLITNHAHSLYQWNIIQIFHPENVTHTPSLLPYHD